MHQPLSQLKHTQSLINLTSNKPKRQGGVYSLEMGKNHGPFLPKDIMPNNPKSIGLLVGSEVVKSHLVMVKALEESEFKMKKNKTLMQNYNDNMTVQHHTTPKNYYEQNTQETQGSAENLFDWSGYLQTELSHLRNNLEQLHLEQRKFKIELEELQFKINARNIQNTAEVAPLLKQLLGKVKESFTAEKNEAYQLNRELENVHRDKDLLIHGLVLCEARIQKLQQAVGINHHQMDEIKSVGSEDQDKNRYQQFV